MALNTFSSFVLLMAVSNKTASPVGHKVQTNHKIYLPVLSDPGLQVYARRSGMHGFSLVSVAVVLVDVLCSSLTYFH